MPDLSRDGDSAMTPRKVTRRTPLGALVVIRSGDRRERGTIRQQHRVDRVAEVELEGGRVVSAPWRTLREVTDKLGWRRYIHIADGWLDGYPEELDPPQAWEHASTGLKAILGREWAGGRRGAPLRWHLSVSADGRIPTWHELVDAAHGIRPGVAFVVGVPPRSWWMNVHPHVLHLWETDDRALIEEWRVNARGDSVT